VRHGRLDLAELVSPDPSASSPAAIPAATDGGGTRGPAEKCRRGARRVRATHHEPRGVTGHHPEQYGISCWNRAAGSGVLPLTAPHGARTMMNSMIARTRTALGLASVCLLAACLGAAADDKPDTDGWVNLLAGGKLESNWTTKGNWSLDKDGIVK